MYLRLSMMANSTKSSSKTYITISELGPFDVLCGRSKACWNNIGNLRFREVINAKLPMYLNSGTNFMRCLANREIAKELLDTSNPRGSFRFFKRASDSTDGSNSSDDERTLVELLDEKESSTKIAQALRDSAVRHKKRKSRISGTKYPKPSTVESDSGIIGARFDSERTLESSNFDSERTIESTVASSLIGEPYDGTITKIGLSNNSEHMADAASIEDSEENCFSSLFSELMVAEIGEVASDVEAGEGNCSFSSIQFSSSIFGDKADAKTPEENCNSSSLLATNRQSLKESHTTPLLPLSSGACKEEGTGKAPTRRVGSAGGNNNNDFILGRLRAPQSSFTAKKNAKTNDAAFSVNLKKHLALSQKVHDEMICRYRKKKDALQDSS